MINFLLQPSTFISLLKYTDTESVTFRRLNQKQSPTNGDTAEKQVNYNLADQPVLPGLHVLAGGSWFIQGFILTICQEQTNQLAAIHTGKWKTGDFCYELLINFYLYVILKGEALCLD